MVFGHGANISNRDMNEYRYIAPKNYGILIKKALHSIVMSVAVKKIVTFLECGVYEQSGGLTSDTGVVVRPSLSILIIITQ